MRKGRGLRPHEVAALFDRSAGWLRNLEALGILPPAQRDPLNGTRIYSTADVERIRAILAERRRRPEPVAVGQMV